MARFNLKRRQTLGTLGALVAFPLVGCGSGSNPTAPGKTVNYVYTMTNAHQNAVARFLLDADGGLTYLDQTLTGGEGSLGRSPKDTSPNFDIYKPDQTYRPRPDSLQSQSSIFISQAEGLLFCVNAGNPYADSASNTSSISVFSINSNDGSLTLKAKTRVNGIFPNSLSYENGYLYTSYYGWHTNRTVESFRVQSNGTLISISTYQAVQQPTADASPIYQINPYAVSPNNVLINPGKTHLIVNSSNSNQIFKFPLGNDGTLNPNPVITQFERCPVEPSTNSCDLIQNDASIKSVQPFAGAFATVKGNEIYLTSSINHNALDYANFSELNGAPIAPNEIYSGYDSRTACWLVVNPTQTLAFMAMPGDGVIVSFLINKDGSIQQSPQGRPASQINGPIGDMWIDPSGTYLTHIDLQHARVYNLRISDNGALIAIASSAITNGRDLFIQGMAEYTSIQA